MSCTDAPLAAPSVSSGTATLRISPTLSIKGAVAGTPQADALNAAFDRVDRFRLVIRRASNSEVVKDTVITVTPGANSYDLSSPVPSVVPDEQFTVTITAMQGSTTLFESPAITVAAVPENAPPGAVQVPKIQLEYSGPGASAAAVTLTPTAILLGSGATRTLTAGVQSATGSAVAGVPLSWSSSATGVATVTSAGVVTTVGEGATRITATAPSGVGASAWIYVASGEITYVQGGHVRARSLLGGTATDLTPGASAATAPSYGPGGSPLVWSDGGRVFVGGAAVTEGDWPAVSPDGTKLAVDRGGQVFFTNINGSNPTAGPGGGAPVWMADNASLLVGGGGVQRVKADGTGRTTLAPGASFPTVDGGGQIAYTSGGDLQVQGKGTVASGISGRAAFSASGRWLLASTGSDLVLADVNGLAPAFPLGIAGASDPAWRGAAPGGNSPSLLLSSLAPSPAVPGADVRIVGRGFDWIIPANNSVFFPSAAGPVRGTVKAVTETQLTAPMPLGTTAGSIRVVSPNGEGTIAYAPSVGTIRVRASFAGGATPAPGLSLAVTKGGVAAGTGTTDKDGAASFDLAPGSYSVALTIPDGYRVFGANPVPVTLGFEVRDVVFEVGIAPVEVTLTPASPVAVSSGTPVTVRARAFDAAHREIASFNTVRWIGSTRVGAAGSTMEGVITALSASQTEGDAPFGIYLDGQVFEFSATSRVHIEGKVTESGAPVRGVAVTLKNGSGVTLAGATTDVSGSYRFGGLMAGSYQVVATPPGVQTVSPSVRSVTLGAVATGQDFTIGGGGGSEATGYLRSTVMVCGSSSHSPTTFFPSGTSFTVVNSCAPDANTQALFITRYGSGYNASVLQGYVNAGGIVITEYSISHTVWNAIFGTAVGQGAYGSGCTDILPSVVQFNASDPFWSGVPFQNVGTTTGCGYSVGHFPGITPLAGWDATRVALGYRNLGTGRVWAADWDWQDNEVYPFKAYTEQALGYMMTHRGTFIATPPPAPPLGGGFLRSAGALRAPSAPPELPPGSREDTRGPSR